MSGPTFVLKLNVAGVAGYFEVSDALSDQLRLSKLAVGADVSAFTGDGVHPNAAGYRKIVKGGWINPQRLIY